MRWELVRQEVFKLASQRFVYGLIAIVAILEIIMAVVTARAPAESSLDVINASGVFATGAEAGLRGAIYVLLVIGAMSLSREFSLGTAKTFLVLPVRRIDWLVAKLIALTLLGVGLVALVFALGAVVAAIDPGWGAIQQDGIVMVSGHLQLRRIAVAAAFTGLLMLPVSAFAFTLGLHFTSSGAAVGVAVLLGLILDAAGNLSDTAGRYDFLAWVGRPLGQIERMSKGLPCSWGTIGTWGLGLAAVSSAVLVAWTLWRFERMDIPG